VSEDELVAPDAAPQSPGQAPPSPDYVLGPKHPPSPGYVHGPEEPEIQRRTLRRILPTILPMDETMLMMSHPMMMRSRRLLRMMTKRSRSIQLWPTLLLYLLMTLSPHLRIQRHSRPMSLHLHLYHHLDVARLGCPSDPTH
nr:hypothetical protein [Tanacetum cinerariifolium]